MIEIAYDDYINKEEIVGVSTEELEKAIEEKIAKGLSSEMVKHIEDMSFIDMEMTDAGTFHIKAELVLCSKNDIVTNIQKQSVKLAEYGLTEEQILDVLETTVEKNDGF